MATGAAGLAAGEAFLTGPVLEAKVDFTAGFLAPAAVVLDPEAVLEAKGFLDVNGEALDVEVVVPDEAGLDVAAFLAAVDAVVRLANGTRGAVVAGLVVDDAVGAAGFVVVLDDRGALVAVVPFCLAVVVLAGEAVLAVAVDLAAVVGAAFFSAMGLVGAAGVGLFVATGDALAPVVAGLGVGPVLEAVPVAVVVLALEAVGLVVLVAEPGAGLAVLVAVEDAAGLVVVGVVLLAVADEGLDEVVGAAGFLVAPAPGLAAPVVLGVVDLDVLEGAALGAVLGAVLGAEIGLELVGLAGADLSPGFLAAGPVAPATGFLAFGLLAVTAAAVAPAAAAPAAAAAMTATTSLVSSFCVSSSLMGSSDFSTRGASSACTVS